MAKSLPTLATLIVYASLVAPACQAPGWDGEVRSWGTLRSVLHEGETGGRVELGSIKKKKHGYGIGALRDLAGEVMIHDGTVWVSYVDRPGHVRTGEAEHDDEAALLAVTYVPEWNEYLVPSNMTIPELERLLAEIARTEGIQTTTFPFILQGLCNELKFHVINHECPQLAGGSTENPPYRSFRPNTPALLVGFYTDEEPGELTHVGTKTHIHAVTTQGHQMMGHVDDLIITKGAVLSLPKLPPEKNTES